MTTERAQFAILGGSGLYAMPELTDLTTITPVTPYGKPSDAITIGTLHGVRVAFLPRHGRGHVFQPSEIPYRANLYALKAIGVTHVIGVSACGSLREDYAPGHVCIPDNLYDNTKDERGRSFFERGIVAHVSVADPFCPDLSRILAEATSESGGVAHSGGTFVTIEGPRFSTKAESNLYRQMGFSIIGMTTSPEAFLAREAELCYAVMAHITDYDVWHEEHVSVEMVMKQFQANITLAQRAVSLAVKKLLVAARACTCENALQGSFATSKDRITPELRERLRPIIGKYFA
ncbi:MAG TPA: S-methyl-5'-thioadenosine phosphorylase [Aggregatilineales bacterium]|nr:S-methyl-5'-thioadenosine phosphorylase [Aggregatilineales bacterium]